MPVVNRALDALNKKYLPGFSAWFKRNGPKIQRYWSQLADLVGKMAHAWEQAWPIIEPIIGFMLDALNKLLAAVNKVADAVGKLSSAWNKVKGVADAVRDAGNSGGGGGPRYGRGGGGSGDAFTGGVVPVVPEPAPVPVPDAKQSKGAAAFVNCTFIGTGEASAAQVVDLIDTHIRKRSRRLARGYA
jgi:hypothetical protein